jgi:hypothetical protein
MRDGELTTNAYIGVFNHRGLASAGGSLVVKSS